MAVTKYLDKTGLTHFWSKIKAWCNATFAAITHSHAWSTITSKPTTISGYNITDAKIANGTITLGSNSITPLTSHQTLPTLSRTISGSGNAITDITVSNHAITATKGSTFLTSHQSLANYVTLNTAQTISAVKTFTAKPVLNQVGLDMTVKDTNADTLRTYQVLHANSDNTGYGLNVAFGGGGNTVVGGGESHTTQLNALAGDASENLYLVADGNIYFKTNGQTFANAKTVTLNNAAELSGLAKVTSTSFVGSLTGNASSATEFSANKSVTLAGAVTGTASSKAGWNIDTIWRSCIVGQSGNSSTNPWYKVATCAANRANDDITVIFLVENTYYSHSSGILKIHVRTDGNKIISTDASEIFWISCSRGIADTLDQFVLVCPTAASSTVEFWTKISNPYMHRRFTVLSEGSRADTWVRWTLLNASTAGQEADITTAGTQIESTLASTSSVCLGNATAATKLVTARTINVQDASATNTGTGASFDGSENVTIKLPATIKASITGNCSGSSGSCTGNAATVTGTAGTSTLAWNSEVTLYTVGGHAIKAKLPANPNTNTDTLVTQNVSTTNARYPILCCPTADATANQGAKTSIFASGVKVRADTSELMTVGSNAHIRQVQGNYGIFWRNDGSNFYLLKTASGDAYGNWDSTRPLTVNLSTGVCNINGNAATATKATKDGSGNTITSTYVAKAGDTMTGQLVIDRVASGAGGSLRIKGNAINYAISLQDTGVTKGTALGSTRYLGIDFYGNTYSDYKNRFGVIENQVTGTTSKLMMAAYNSTTATNTGTCAISVRVDASGNGFAEAPTPASDANDTRIATTKWVKDRGYITSSGSITGNAATATKFASAQSVTLTGAITGTASSQAGWSIGTIWRSCMVGQSSSTNTKPWYKVATCVVDSDHAVYNIVFLVEDTYYVHDSVGILKIHIRTEDTSAINLEATELFWMSSTASIANNLDHYVLVCPTTTNPTVELWTKIPYGYQHKRFTVLTEGTRASTQIKWTLLNASTAGQAASITTSGTQIESKLRSVASSCTGNAATATKLATARNINGVAFNGSANITIADSTKLPLAGGTLTGNLIVSKSGPAVVTKSTGMTRGTAPSANVNTVEILGQDSAGKSTWGIYHTYSTTMQNQVQLICYKGTTTDTSWVSIGVGYDASGNSFTNAPTPATADNSTKIATTAFVKAQGYLTSHQSLSAYAKLASPALTGTPTAPTAATSTNNTQIATTAFVKAQGYLTSHQTLPTLSLTNSGSGNAVTAISVSNHAITVTKGTTFLTSHQSLSNYVTLDGSQTITGSKNFSWIALKNATIDRTLADTTTDHWFIAGCYLDKNGKSLIDLGFHRKEDRTWSLRLYDASGTQHWMMFQGINHDGTSPYISVGGDFHTMDNGNKYCGLSGRRWKAVYAVNGTIQTSDERIKEDIDKLPEAVLDAWESIEWMQFRMKSSVEKKGNSARLHSGIIAQHARDAFASVGLDASDYGFFCWDQWDKTPAMLDENGEITIPEMPAGDQYSIRYDEALAIEAAYQRRKNKILENRISELEKRLAKLEGTV